ncbi:hypothetical protein Leryth_024188 [Lithospermum erythrorhizon]|nr:hypothetical protein Leryth_024188 [Lithospermum erythrorhizon]
MASDDAEREEDEAAEDLFMRDRFRLSTISIAESQAKQLDLEISRPIVACISDLAFKYTEIVAKDLALFAQHGGRKSVNMEDVILAVHRNEHLTTSMRSFSNGLKSKEPQSERKRRKKANRDLPYIPDISEILEDPDI